MNYLLDTHALIWFLNGDNQLPTKSKNIIKKLDNKCYVSIASIWEIAIKISLNKLYLNGGFGEIAKIITKYDFELLPITIEHIAGIIDLDFYHRDPFDRIIVAQGIIENIPIITKDENFEKYDVEVVWS
ncbi:MAG: type II toxin-antitoxin system VapC family toxin [Flavobacteriales bacterium]|nr:type II toxin-antitoxin system VapC family toxin [Flavobacteriales bacterium]